MLFTTALAEDPLKVLTEDDLLLKQLLGKLGQPGYIGRDDLFSLQV